MLAQMDKITKPKKGGIIVGELITFIALALGLGREVAQPIPFEGSTFIDLNLCLSQRLIKLRKRNEYYLMIRNEVIKIIVLSNSTFINVHIEGNWLYPIEVS